jgi:mono/diheme cytochrome c family protein
MCKRLLLGLVVSVIGVAGLAAQTKSAIKKVPLTRTSPASGKEMFATYCAVCHGAGGAGNGPAASALKSQPTNLTRLSAANGGKYPELRVANILDGKDVVAHGSQEMPVWGDLFKTLNSGDRDLVHMRVANLTSFLQSIQAK